MFLTVTRDFFILMRHKLIVLEPLLASVASFLLLAKVMLAIQVFSESG